MSNNGKICVSICAKTAREFLENISRAESIDGVDVIELRFDCLDESELENAIDAIKGLKTEKPFLATFRPKQNEARLMGLRIFSNEQERIRVKKALGYRFSGWAKIITIENVKYVDLEEDMIIMPDWFGTSDEYKLIIYPCPFSTEAEEQILARRIIFSRHYFEGVPENIERDFEYMVENDGDDFPKDKMRDDIVKIAVQADDICDSLTVMKLSERAKVENKEFIPIAMGEAGKWTRIFGLAKGAFMTYAALDDDKQTASGQFTAQDLIDVYRVKQLDENTSVYGLIGNPVSQSVSPEMHNAAFKFHNRNAVFVPFQVKNLDEFIARMVKPETREIEWNLSGFSVTIPHKQNIIRHLDFIDETAAKIGAVNTVKIVEGKLHGYNTDAQGFIEPLRNSFGDLKNAKVAIIGAGGAARAAIYSLKREGANVTIFARNINKAQSLAEEFDIETKDLSETKNKTPKTVFNDFDILVNATPQGMKGDFINETPFFASQLEGLNLLYDLIYNPFTTKLMREADTVFVPTLGGLAMLVAQAMAQQKIWTSLDAPMREMSQAALNKLGN